MPFFRRREQVDADGFYETVDETAVVEGRMTPVKVAGRQLLLTRWQSGLYAFAATCPHAAASLADGEVSRYKVICPEHDYCFDVRNGRILWPEDEMYRLRTYPVKVVDGKVWVQVA